MENIRRNSVRLSLPHEFAVAMTPVEARIRKEVAERIPGIDFEVNQNLQQNVLIGKPYVAGVTTVHSNDALDEYNKVVWNLLGY